MFLCICMYMYLAPRRVIQKITYINFRSHCIVGVAITDLTTGLYAHGAILAALLARQRSGKGQRLDISLLESQVASLANIGSNFLIGGQVCLLYNTLVFHFQRMVLIFLLII
jgi:crotonobetainyl-CoA:carnitine CoA-transferase CaiB-like acyl-CoA transferase